MPEHRDSSSTGGGFLVANAWYVGSLRRIRPGEAREDGHFSGVRWTPEIQPELVSLARGGKKVEEQLKVEVVDLSVGVEIGLNLARGESVEEPLHVEEVD